MTLAPSLTLGLWDSLRLVLGACEVGNALELGAYVAEERGVASPGAAMTYAALVAHGDADAFAALLAALRAQRQAGVA